MTRQQFRMPEPKSPDDGYTAKRHGDLFGSFIRPSLSSAHTLPYSLPVHGCDRHGDGGMRMKWPHSSTPP